MRFLWKRVGQTGEITLAVSSQRRTKTGVLRHMVQGQGVAGSYV